MAKIVPVKDAPLPGIEHIVVVMFENRSFDNVLGLFAGPPDFDGVPLGASNSYKTILGEWHTVTVTDTPPSGNPPRITPFPDPGESFDDMCAQIRDGSMKGFAQNYHDVTVFKKSTIGDIMFCFADGELPVTHLLGRAFAISDRWFASGPVQTFPNRMFCHCGTPGTYTDLFGTEKAMLNDIDYVVKLSLDINVVAGAVTHKSVFELLDEAAGEQSAANWKVYFHDAPMSAINAYVNDAWRNGSPCVAQYDGSDYHPKPGIGFFAEDVANDALPAYSFIEPRYFDNYSNSKRPASSNHPGGSATPGIGNTPIDVLEGERLLADIFLTLAENPPVFDKTLLIVVYDEHGGLFDHVPPPAAQSPFKTAPANFDYSQYGVRVPAIFINPHIAPLTLHRAPENGPPFDHCSIIATLRAQFGLGEALTPRDEVAPILKGLIRRDLDFVVSSVYHDAVETLRAWRAGRPAPAGMPQPFLPPEEHDRKLTAHVQGKVKA